ncbi:GntR family transcriptional regulator [Shimia abyssi]|uniref:DNA-binding GntR family transcriptional regulator n=1 Tax=Shimia abyssi TaxID=1662395 RepID=A0A2P8FF64_9RHOB|nr:GntR family transcriptional regulator [Shimia abyssi]PSL20363.1 DNA-binding GntR family transcriptional regulator [Shimia abyssi]
MKHQTAKPLSNTQRAIHELRELIFSGDLPAGSDHLESELATRLNMSRTPIREAALTLEGQGLLELRPRKGVRILPVSVEDMVEIYDVLTELESLSARRAAERNLNSIALTPLAKSIEDMENALVSGALEDWANADDLFHQELVNLAGNSRIKSIVSMMNDQVRRARSITLFMRPLPLKSNEDHRQVFEAIKSGDGERASLIHKRHRQNAKKLIVGLLEKHRLNKI